MTNFFLVVILSFDAIDLNRNIEVHWRYGLVDIFLLFIIDNEKF